jgi:nitrate/nitrite transporter NarK
MRLVMLALILIILASFYHLQISEVFSLSSAAENKTYSLGMFWAAAIGGYGVVLTALGFVLSPHKNDPQIRLLRYILGITAMIFFFFYLMSSTIDSPPKQEHRRLRKGETITI